jgi:hypothetical protein
MVAPDGTVITVPTGTLLLLTAVQTDQFLNALLGDALSSGFAQAFISARNQVLSAGLARVGALEGYRGQSAGEGEGPVGLWINAAGTRIKDDRVGRDQKGWARSVAIGADYAFDGAALGLFAAYNDLDIDGPFAAHESDGWTGGVYGSFRLADNWAVTGVVGYTGQDVENDRSFGVLRSRGTTERKQIFGTISLDGQYELAENWVLAPTASLFLSDSKTDAYVDNAGRTIGRIDNKLSILRAGSALFYRTDFISPYVSAAWDHYLDNEVGTDNDYGRVGAGLSISVTPGSYLAVGVSTTVLRKDERETTIGATLGGRF